MSVTGNELSKFKISNTFGVEAYADRFIKLESTEQLPGLVSILRGSKYFILGGGSNTLFRGDFHGTVVANQLRGIVIKQHPDGTAEVSCGAGENWADFVDYCVEFGWYGLENLSLIPGCVGASPIQNIGAYGVEVCQAILKVDAFSLLSGESRKFSKEDCLFGYRDSIFKRPDMQHWLITSVSFSLSKTPALTLTYSGLRAAAQALASQRGAAEPDAVDVASAVKHIRISKLPDPKVIGNAGSFFKNPVVTVEKATALQLTFGQVPVYPVANDPLQKKLSAGWLIDQSGWKGFRRGNAGVHRDHALVLVNYGQATGNEIWALAMDIQASVQAKFGVQLVPEPIVL
jgi:UDP-N-acetylmuramate dehydrogenase